MSLEPKIDGYEVEGRLGQGGMGEVYSAIETSTCRRVAIKVLQTLSTFSDSELLSRFNREVKVCRGLSHPNVVNYVADGKSSDGSRFLVMELVQGKSLREIVTKEGKLTKKRWLDLAKELAKGLAHFHEQGLIHRDLKPDNIMVTPEGRGVIIDFGLVQADGMTRLTATGMRLGTVECMAPEQLRGEKLDSRTDIYSLGVTLHFALTGTWLYSRSELLASLRNENIVPKAELHPIIRKCCAFRKEFRYESATQLLAALVTLENSSDGSSDMDFQSGADLQPTVQVRKVHPKKEAAKNAISAKAAKAADVAKSSRPGFHLSLLVLTLVVLCLLFAWPKSESGAVHEGESARNFAKLRQDYLKRNKSPSTEELVKFGKLVDEFSGSRDEFSRSANEFSHPVNESKGTNEKTEYKKSDGLSMTKKEFDDETKALVYLLKRAEEPLRQELLLHLLARKGLSWHRDPSILIETIVRNCIDMQVLERFERACHEFLKVKDQAEVRFLGACLNYHKSKDSRFRILFTVDQRRKFLQKGVSLITQYGDEPKVLLYLPKLAVVLAHSLKELDEVSMLERWVRKWKESKLVHPFPWGDVYYALAAAKREKDEWTEETIPWLLEAWKHRRSLTKRIRWGVIDKIVIACTKARRYKEALKELDKEPLESYHRDNYSEVLLHRVNLLIALGRKKEARVVWQEGKSLLQLGDTSQAIDYNFVGQGL